ncbi:MAG TPA: hypothetical protein VFG69_05300, partial [Nannocystaceae bacterium]|nr:hypothetical protein [Nannocystaceae bacterium]
EPPPTALHVAMEGRCEYMNVSVVSGEPFVAHGGGGYRSTRGVRHDLIAARVAADGTVAEQLPAMSEPTVAPELGVYSIAGFSGRWPGQLFAELDVGYRDTSSNDLARLDANGWVAVDPFGKAKAGEEYNQPALHRVHPWYEKSILAVGDADNGVETRFAVVRGKPKGPRFTAAKAKTGCKEPSVTAYEVVESGDVVAGWSCSSADKGGTFVTHWPKGDLDGTTTRMDDEIVAIEHDGRGSFWLLLSDERRAKLVHGKGSDWSAVELPAKGVAQRMAVDAEGMPWIVIGNRIHIRGAEGWTSEDLPGKGKVEELVGVEHGTPWIRRGGTSGWDLRSGATIHRRGDDGWHDIEVPPSAFFAGKDVAIDRLAIAGPDDVWAEGHYFVRRHGKSGPARHYRVVLHSRAVLHPQRCGEVVDGPITAAFAKWPTAVNAGCTTRMALLFREAKWDDTNEYPKLRKAIRAVAGLEGARLVQAEVGGEKFLAALVATDATADALLAKARKLRPYRYPEVVCGDQAVLDAAGVVVHRELATPTSE